jgi:hypothetical protein
MTRSITATLRHVTPTQVWAHVPVELQQRAIQLLAHLALHWVAAHTTGYAPFPCPQEVSHEDGDNRVQAAADAP